MKLQELFERLTSPHVLSKSDLTAIMNMVEKEFGPPDVDNLYGTCLVSQICATLAAVTECSPEEIKQFLESIKIKDSNNLSSILKAINSKPIHVNNKVLSFQTSAFKIKNAAELKKEINQGQPVMCAYTRYNVIGKLLEALEVLDSHYSYDKQLGILCATLTDIQKVKNSIKEADLKKFLKQLNDGFVSKECFEAFIPFFKEGYSGSAGPSYHSGICFGYDGGDDAFLFRESRHWYAKNGYYKIAAKLFTPKYLTLESGFIAGLFYVQVDDLKIEASSRNEDIVKILMDMNIDKVKSIDFDEYEPAITVVYKSDTIPMGPSRAFVQQKLTDKIKSALKTPKIKEWLNAANYKVKDVETWSTSTRVILDDK
jgi:hypothetical protein